MMGGAGLQEAEEDGLATVISTMVWAGMDALVLACSLYSNEDDDMEVRHPCSRMVMLHGSVRSDPRSSASHEAATVADHV